MIFAYKIPYVAEHQELPAGPPRETQLLAPPSAVLEISWGTPAVLTKAIWILSFGQWENLVNFGQFCCLSQFLLKVELWFTWKITMITWLSWGRLQQTNARVQVEKLGPEGNWCFRGLCWCGAYTGYNWLGTCIRMPCHEFSWPASMRMAVSGRHKWKTRVHWVVIGTQKLSVAVPQIWYMGYTFIVNYFQLPKSRGFRFETCTYR